MLSTLTRKAPIRAYCGWPTTLPPIFDAARAAPNDTLLDNGSLQKSDGFASQQISVGCLASGSSGKSRSLRVTQLRTFLFACILVVGSYSIRLPRGRIHPGPDVTEHVDLISKTILSV